MALIIIAGKSGSGKDAVIGELARRGYKNIIKYTTRPMRKHESQGKPYYFISEKEFKKKESNGLFLIVEEFHSAKGTWYYGSLKEELLNLKNNSENWLIFLPPKGIEKLSKDPHSKEINSKIIYLRANSGTIAKRLRRRGDDPEEVQRRIEADENDFVAFEYFADKCVYNNSGTELNDVVDIIDDYIKNL